MTQTIRCPCRAGKGTIEPGPPMRLTPIQAKIYEAVRAAKHGIPISKLADQVYADRIDGGPETSWDVIRTQVCQMNKRLAAAGENVRSEGKLYRLFRHLGGDGDEESGAQLLRKNDTRLAFAAF
jgi:hypothetical protein